MNKIELININNLIPSHINPRDISGDSFNKLCESILEDFDFLKSRPLLVYPSKEDDGKYIIYAGNQRYKACLHLGYDEIPCIVDYSDEDIIKRRMLLDNSHYGEWDLKFLKENFDVNITEFFDFNFEDDFNNKSINDLFLDTYEAPKTKKSNKSKDKKEKKELIDIQKNLTYKLKFSSLAVKEDFINKIQNYIEECNEIEYGDVICKIIKSI